MNEDTAKIIVKNAIEENKSLKLTIRVKQITAVKTPDETVTRNKEEYILLCIIICKSVY